MTLVWIAIALVFAILEVGTVALFAGFVSVGALGAAVAAFLTADILTQAVVFAAVSLLGIVAVRRRLLAHLQAWQAPEVRSGADAMIGEMAAVVDSIGGGGSRGHVRIAGEDWPALSRDGTSVAVGAEVRIVAISGATLVVEPAPAVMENPWAERERD